MNHETLPAQGPVDVNVRPVAWLHDQPERYDVVHDEARALWLKAWPKQVEHYTIPLYRYAERQPLSTDAACALLKDTLGIDPGWVSSDEETGGVVLTLRLEEVGESLDVLILDEDGNDAFDPREQPFVLHGWVRTDELAAPLLP